jgi:hypothetical protein
VILNWPAASPVTLLRRAAAAFWSLSDEVQRGSARNAREAITAARRRARRRARARALRALARPGTPHIRSGAVSVAPRAGGDSIAGAGAEEPET